MEKGHFLAVFQVLGEVKVLKFSENFDNEGPLEMKIPPNLNFRDQEAVQEFLNQVARKDGLAVDPDPNDTPFLYKIREQGDEQI